MHLGDIDRSSDRPAYKQIADNLRRLITSGRLSSGEKLPSEASLVEYYDVARMTVRQAREELHSEGAIVVEHGKGVFVRQLAPARRLTSERFARRNREREQAAFLAGDEKPETEPTVDHRQVYEAPPSDEVRERLRIMPDDLVLVRSGRYVSNGVPAETAVSYLPTDIARKTPIGDANPGPGRIYARIEELGHELDHFVEEVSARMPTFEERTDLDLGASVPIMRVLRVAYDVAGRAVEVCDTIKAAPAYILEYSISAQ